MAEMPAWGPSFCWCGLPIAAERGHERRAQAYALLHRQVVDHWIWS